MVKANIAVEQAREHKQQIVYGLRCRKHIQCDDARLDNIVVLHISLAYAFFS